MSDIEGLKRPEPIGTKSRERLEGTTDEAKLLSSVGERLCPEGLKYLGTFACHIYDRPLANEMVFMAQSTDLRAVPEIIANEAIKELARSLVIKYRGKVPKKIGEDNTI